MHIPPAFPTLTRLRDRFFYVAFSRYQTVLFSASLVFIGGFFLISWIFINRLEREFREVTDMEARLYAVAISERLSNSELNWVFKEIVRNTRFPVVITDRYNKPTFWKNIHRGFLVRDGNRLPENLTFYQLTRNDQDFLRHTVGLLDKGNAPLKLETEGDLLGYFHYGEKRLINNLAWMPFLEFLFLVLFLFVAYFGFQTLRSSEQSLLWVALAKETAHQMGTPLSSLLGWLEYLKLKFSALPPGDRGHEIAAAMESDINRLSRVSTRFQRIGSIPELELGSLDELVASTTQYFEHRLPHLGKKVGIRSKLGGVPKIWMNAELMSWVLENLVKNALDSIQATSGMVYLTTTWDAATRTAEVTVTDNGRGIERENWKNVFQTGYSTKKRGWGLGLSLARRIVTIYHEGDIRIDWSIPGRGTQFRVRLPEAPERIRKKARDGK